MEIKGFPSTPYARGPKVGQPKPTPLTLQARHSFGQALLAYVLTHSKLGRTEVALGPPDMPPYHNLIEQARWALESLAIGVSLVREDGAVERLLCHDRSA